MLLQRVENNIESLQYLPSVNKSSEISGENAKPKNYSTYILLKNMGHRVL